MSNQNNNYNPYGANDSSAQDNPYLNHNSQGGPQNPQQHTQPRQQTPYPQNPYQNNVPNQNRQQNQHQGYGYQQQPNYQPNGYQNNPNPPGKGQATASLVLGIIAVVCWFFGYSSIVSIILGIIGIVLASKAKKAGFNEGIRTAGFVLSLIGLIGGGIAFIACVACVGSLAAIGAGSSTLYTN